MAKKSAAPPKNTLVYEVDPTECPFREFRDTDLSPDFWGMGPAPFRAASQITKGGSKPPMEPIWSDDQTQPLPRSVRQYLHGWIRAEDLAMDRWESEVVIFEDNDGGKMSISDIQLSHAQVLLRSSFCRRVLSACFILERAVEGFIVEHQWENFAFALGPEGWRARYHIYSPGMKPGGGMQHRPTLSKNGCYLVRLFYLGCWRCVWVSDQVPVDATDSPLLPFSPLLSHAPVSVKAKGPAPPPMVTAPVVHLWPLLICKALLKLAAPDMNCDEEIECFEDETMPEFNILHTLTGAMNLQFNVNGNSEKLWQLITDEVSVFSWDDDDDTMASTIKSKSTKKPSNKETEFVKSNVNITTIFERKNMNSKSSMVTIVIEDTKNLPPYALPGITPGHEMSLIVTMARDLPLKRPLPEPDVPLWKNYRWVEWARRHGLYEAYDCPRTKFLKVNGLMKLSYAPHLLDVQSTDSITFNFREEQDKTNPPPLKKGAKEMNRSFTNTLNTMTPQMKEELREWILYDAIQTLVRTISILYFPSLFQYTTAASAPSIRITKVPNRALEIQASKSAPLYIQIDGPEENVVRISLNMIHPRIFMNSGVPIDDYIEPAYFIMERFEFFMDTEVPLPKAFVKTKGYDTVEIKFLPGRHFCRIWVHSRTNWHLAVLSQSNLLLGTRDLILSAAVLECPWSARFLSVLGAAFNNWIRVNRSNTNFIVMADREFYNSYQPDLDWDTEVIGYNKALLHWMFRKALQSLLCKRMSAIEFQSVCPILRRYFCDPDFGFPEKPLPAKSLRTIVNVDPCDCIMPEAEETEVYEEQIEIEELIEEKPLVDSLMMDELLKPPKPPATSQVCELATEDLPCGLLKEEREKVIRKHEAATFLQAHWRGTWARKCLTHHVFITPEVMKSLMDNAFGNLESLSALMNEFFLMYPGTKYAYSVGSALSGVYGVRQSYGTSPLTVKCKWVPYFQGVFYCHAPVKVHFDVHSNLPYSTISVYNNDTGRQMPQLYNAHITFNFAPNMYGYTVMGHGTLSEPAGISAEVHWQLTVLSCTDNVFHVCDNNEHDDCKELPLPPASKLHLDEVFIPNRRNILGGIQISVMKHESVSFRIAATSPDLKMEAILRTRTADGETEELDRCEGTGEIHWPFIRLEPMTAPLQALKKRSMSHANLSMPHNRSPRVSRSAKPISAGGRTKSSTKMKENKPHQEAKQYFIQVVAPNGWPLTLVQWKRVIEVRNTQVNKTKPEVAGKRAGKEKGGSAKDKDSPVMMMHQPQPEDAYVELECSYAIGGGAQPKRDDERDLEFAAARRAWDLHEPGRNLRGAQLRAEFRAEFLEALPPPPSESAHSFLEELFGEEIIGEHEIKDQSPIHQGPSPVTESGLIEMTIEEEEEEAKYLTMPELLKDKFVPLYFVPLCTKEQLESVLVTADRAKAAKKERHARIDAAIERMNELQTYNETFVLLRQKRRCQLLEKLFTDAQWNSELTEAMEGRDEAIAQETLARNLSATKKKQEATQVKKK